MTVTAIITTYNRPDALSAAIESLRLQTVRNWRALIIGDCCTPTTGEAVSAFGDERLSYINLPARSGEQSLPTSVGMRLAATPLIAFLNHDDLWLPDHLERALRALEDPAVDVFLGASAFADTTVQDNGAERPLFHHVTASDRTLLGSFTQGVAYLEPLSSWVIRKRLADHLGDWRHSLKLHRTPLQDWALRAARTGAQTAVDRTVSVLKITTHRSSRKLHYSEGAGHQNWALDAIGRLGADGVRALVTADVHQAKTARRKPRIHGASRKKREREYGKQLLTPFMAQVYRRTGWDSYDIVCALARVPRGKRFRGALKQRTGEQITDVPTVDALLAGISAQTAPS